MPWRPCLNCGQLVKTPASYCCHCDPSPDRYREKRGSGWAQGSFRQAVLANAGHRCQRCGNTRNLEAHHVTPVAEGGSHHPDNGRALCRDCHGLETQAQAERPTTAPPLRPDESRPA